MKQLTKILALTFGITLFFSCGKDESTTLEDTPKFNYGYFPTTIKTYIEYDVNEIDVEVTLNKYDTSFYHIREEITEKFTDNEGRDTRKIIRYRKNIGETDWLVKDVWYSNRTTTTAERVEENVRYLKFIFPTIVNKEWDGNVYNQFDGWEYKITSLDAPLTLGTLKFDSVATVKQTGFISAIGSEKGEEKYAKNVGMVYKTYTTIGLKSVLGGFVADKYYHLDMTAKAYGKIK